jgi:GST-like protein
MNRRRERHEYLAGPYSVADVVCVGWTKGWDRMGQDMDVFLRLKRWLEAALARPAVQRGVALDVPGRRKFDLANDEQGRKVLFGQRAR